MSNGSKWADITGPMPMPPKTTPAGMGVGGPRREGLVYERVYEWRSYPEEAPLITRKQDPDDPESPEVEEPVRWWTPRSIGFRAKILVNPLGGELRRAARAHIRFMTLAGPEDDHLKIIADRVAEWEYVIVEPDGTHRVVPPPSADLKDDKGEPIGWMQFWELPNDCLIWLKEEIENAHVPKPLTPAGKPAGTTESPAPAPEKSDPDPALRPSSSRRRARG